LNLAYLPGIFVGMPPMEREVWFEKWLWSYMPCHWKGVAAMVAVIASTLAAIFLARRVVGENADWLQLPIFFVGLVTMLIICKRHSR
jgi:hypothetical protein